jgi:hypothetical protein
MKRLLGGRRRFLGLFVAICLCVVAMPIARCADDEPTTTALVSVQADKVLHTTDRHMLIGSNIALWNLPVCFESPEIRQWLEDLGIGVLRMPGGSWADITYWNGNGMRKKDGESDPTRTVDGGYPAIDYSDYASAILLNNKWEITASKWHGNVDVKTQHEYIRKIPGCQAIVTVNAGTGRAKDAAEWVRWANKKMGYNIKYWEIGNELEGYWEAGHWSRDGRELTGDEYARRFIEFAKAMKAVDPTIQVGGPTSSSVYNGFLESLLSIAGDQVDFISYHNYPLHNGMKREEMVASAENDSAHMNRRIRDAEAKYQPARVDKIPIFCTEWNCGVQGGLEVDMFGAEWSAVFVGELFRNGVAMANHWDAFTNPKGGALMTFEKPLMRNSQYWAFWLWSHYMADSIVDSSVEGSKYLKAYATRSDDAVYIMAINYSENCAVDVEMNISGFDPEKEGESALFSTAQMFWNAQAKRLEWSNPPLVTPMDVGKSFKLHVPSTSIRCVRVPVKGKPGVSELANQGEAFLKKDHGTARLRIIAPKSEYADTPVQGWVLATCAGTTEPYPVALPPATISLKGHAKVTPDKVRMSVPAGCFSIQPTGPGNVVVTASLDGQTTFTTIAFKPVVPRPHPLWNFEENLPVASAGGGEPPKSPYTSGFYESDWMVELDGNVKANQKVAKVDLTKPAPSDPNAHGPNAHGRNMHDKLIGMRLPPPDTSKIDHAGIRGMFFEVATSPDFKCDDPNANIEIVMQSFRDFWMPLGSVPLPKTPGEWSKQTVMVKEQKHILAMPGTFVVLLRLHTTKPATGSIYIDNAGLMVR